jgi:hypothetical protein
VAAPFEPATRCSAAFDRVAKLILRHSRSAGHVEAGGLAVEIVARRLGGCARWL